MGIYNDFRTMGRTFDSTPEDGINPINKRLVKFLENLQGDPAYVNDYQAHGQIDTIGQIGGTAGTYIITLNIKVSEPANVVSVPTAALDYNAIDTDIEGAIDTALNGVIPGWTNGDIFVLGDSVGGLADDSVSLQYTGSSVSNRRNPTVSVDFSGVTGGVDPLPETGITGQPNRFWLAMLFNLGYFNLRLGVPIYQASPVGSPIPTPNIIQGAVSEFIVREIIRECVYWEGFTYTEEWEEYLLLSTGVKV